MSEQLKGAQLVAKALIERIRAKVREGEGTSRINLKGFNPAELEEFAKQILQDSELSRSLYLKFDSVFRGAFDIADKYFVDSEEDRTLTSYRNEDLPAGSLLILVSGDKERESIVDQLDSIVSEDLKVSPADLLAQITDISSRMTQEDMRGLIRLLEVLVDDAAVSLSQLSNYICSTYELIGTGEPLPQALGVSLFEVGGWKYRSAFHAVNISKATKKQWKSHLNKTLVALREYAAKRTPKGVNLLIADLEDWFEEAKNDITSQHHNLINRFIHTPISDIKTQDEIRSLDWEEDRIFRLFEKIVTKSEKLGAQTISFFAEQTETKLNPDEISLLGQLDETPRRQLDDLLLTLRSFFEQHYVELEQSASLYSRWEKLLFPREIKGGDFLILLLEVIERLISSIDPYKAPFRLHIELAKKSPKAILSKHSSTALWYFSSRYRGLAELLPNVNFDCGGLFAIEELCREYQDRDYMSQFRHREGKKPNELTFRASITSAANSKVLAEQRFVWAFEPASILVGFHEDMKFLSMEGPFRHCLVRRELSSSKGTILPLSLQDVSCLEPVYQRQRGRLVSGDNDDPESLCDSLTATIEHFKQSRSLTDHDADSLISSIEKFAQSYKGALKEFVSHGLAWTGIEDFAKEYYDVSQNVSDLCQTDQLIKSILRPFTRIGTVTVVDGYGVGIIPPWHPLRLTSMYVKARYFANLVNRLLSGEAFQRIDERMFFNDLGKELDHPFYPELSLSSDQFNHHLLTISAYCGDYTLMESPHANLQEERGEFVQNDPSEPARVLIEILRRYLNLQPHERNNLSIMLHSVDSARFPEEVIKFLSNPLDSDFTNVRCKIFLRDFDPIRLRALYEEFLEAADQNQEKFNVNDTANFFLSRLRINVVAEGQDVSDNEEYNVDIAFLMDYIARHAGLQLVPTITGKAVTPDLFDHIPARWSRRRANIAGDMRSSVYLCCPVNPPVVQNHNQLVLRASGAPNMGQTAAPLLPVREVNFDSATVKQVFDEAHRVAHWVVNLDDILDRRQLQAQGVQIIKYRQGRHLDRNLVISSKARLDVLRAMLASRIKHFDLGLKEQEVEEVIDRMINDANSLSGDIVLKAARRGNFASELVGIVLSRFLIESRLNLEEKKRAAWFFLDDYSDWFIPTVKDSEEALMTTPGSLADLMCLVPSQNESGDLCMRTFLVESKYIDSVAIKESERRSLSQLLATHGKLDAVFSTNQDYEDRNLWLARLSDLLLEAGTLWKGDRYSLEEFRIGIRRQEISSKLESFSYIFVHTENEGPVSSISKGLPNTKNARQTRFGRKETRDLLEAYIKKMPLQEVLGRVVDITPKLKEELTKKQEVPASVFQDKQDEASEDKATETITAENLPTAKNLEFNKEAQQESCGETAALETKPISQDGLVAVNQYNWATRQVSDLLQLLPASHSQINSEQENQALSDISEKVVRILAAHNIRAELGPCRVTPNSYRLLIKGQLGFDRRRFENLKDSFLMVEGITLDRVEIVSGYVALSFRRSQRGIVDYLECIKNRQISEGPGNTKILLGCDEAHGDVVYYDINSEDSHALIGGMTKSGKSQLLLAMIIDLALTNTPDELDLVLIDPKKVEFQRFENLPHLVGDIIRDRDIAIRELKELVAEMDRRYEQLLSAGVNDISKYNQRQTDKKKIMKRRVMIFDEFADWMLNDHFKGEVSEAVQRLAGKARAAGIHLVIATQRPDNTVLPMILRANLGAKIALRVDKEANSKIILDEPGAENLLGLGHMIAKFAGRRFVLQGAFIPDATADRIVEGLRRIYPT